MSRRRITVLTTIGALAALLVATVLVSAASQPTADAQSGLRLISMSDRDGHLRPATKVGPDGRLQVMTHDDHLVNIGEVFSGFAGIFRDPNNPEITVVLTTQPIDQVDKVALQEGLEFVFGDQAIKSGGIRLEQARYDFNTLKAWYDELKGSAFGLGTVYTGGVHEQSNSILFGVADLGVSEAIRAIAAQLGIPADVLSFRQMEQPVRSTELDDKVRPIKGGLQIEATAPGRHAQSD